MHAYRQTIAFLLLAVAAQAATFNSDGSQSDVQAKMNLATGSGDIVTLPAGTFNWSSGVTWTAPAGATLIGAGTSATGGGDQTIIVDNLAANSPLIDITIPATGVFRFTGITVRGGTGTLKDEEGVVRFIGPSASVGQIRVDHCTFNQHTYSAPGSAHMPVFANLKGVVDNCILNYYANGSSFIYRNGTSGNGDEVWAADTGFGTDDFIYFEDCEINGGAASLDASSFPSRMWDASEGGKAVLRFCTLKFSSGGEIHATGHAGNGRSGRATETYGNLYAQAVNQGATGRTPRALVDAQGGTALLWGNTANTDSIESYITMSTTRRNSVTYSQSPTPNGWGYVGPVPLATGTVSVTGTAVTKTGGTDFSVLWPASTMIYIVDMVAEGVAGQEPADGPTGGISSVNSTTSITLQNGGQLGGPITGKTYTVGSAWDGNTNAYGYPALDQTGRGRGDLLTGQHPNKVNSTTGTIAWPNQALEPVYIWKNSGTPTVVTYSNGSTNLVVANRDYYEQASGIQTSPTSPFNGTVGVGWGTLANRPTTCTTGVAYFATDQGSWNTSTSNPYGVQQNGADGVLYKATATNTWTLYYEPYTYPHPLRGDQVASPTFSPVAGIYATAQNITISTTTVGATIRYTVDGSTPTSSSGTIYSTPVSISVSTTLKAVAYDGLLIDSNVTTGLYTISSGTENLTVQGTTTVTGTLTLPPP